MSKKLSVEEIEKNINNERKITTPLKDSNNLPTLPLTPKSCGSKSCLHPLRIPGVCGDEARRGLAAGLAEAVRVPRDHHPREPLSAGWI